MRSLSWYVTKNEILFYLIMSFLSVFREGSLARTETHLLSLSCKGNTLTFKPSFFLSNVSKAYRKMMRYEEALADFSYSIRMAPEDKIAYSGRAITYGKR